MPWYEEYWEAVCGNWGLAWLWQSKNSQNRMHGLMGGRVGESLFFTIPSVLVSYLLA
ncbi:MAG: hypothetical protein WAU04_08665 [Candidatus Nitrotoga sp.]